MRMLMSIALVSLAVSFVSPSPEWARPMVKADLDGKSVCWPDGTVEKYTADGKWTSSAEGPGTWWFDDKGRYLWTLQEYPAVTFTGDVQINDDGTKTYTGSAPGDDKVTAAGEFCNK